METPQVKVWSDAAGSWGCGAVTEDGWFQHPWPPEIMGKRSIAILEMIPIVMAAIVWGHQWEGKIVQFNCDNQAVVSIINKLYSRDIGLMHLLRCLVFIAARFNFWFGAIHIEGKRNTQADLISRNKSSLFLPQAPAGMNRYPIAIPPEIPALLYLQEPDWLSPAWIPLFKNIMRPA